MAQPDTKQKSRDFTPEELAEYLKNKKPKEPATKENWKKKEERK
jgi:hypothetical protein